MLNFLTETARDAYTKVYKQRIKNGEIACIKDTQRVYKFVNDSWEPVIANSDSGLKMSLYDLNKIAVENLKPMMASDIITILTTAEHSYYPKKKWTYLMLMCKELSWFTIIKNTPQGEYDTLADAVGDLFTSYPGYKETKSIDINDDATVDIWVLIDDEIYMFKLFPCDEFVVTVGSKGAS